MYDYPLQLQTSLLNARRLREADESMRDKVFRTARLFTPLVIVTVFGIDNPSSDIVVL